VSRISRSLGFRNARAEEVWNAYRSLTNPENRRAFVATMRGVIDPGGQTVSALDRLYLAAHMPVLIVWGERDAIIPVVHAHKVHAAIPGSRLRIMPGVGHFPQAEQPVRFVEILEEFLRDTEPSRITPEEMRALLRQGPG
jgi:pimeloyl-ACP methyl ester carboxylesterase